MNDVTKSKKLNNNIETKNSKVSIFISKTLISIIILLSCLIISNHSSKIHSLMKEKLNNNLKYPNINSKLTKYLGKTLSMPKNNTEQVFSENNDYQRIEEFDDKNKVIYGKNTTINALQSGIVVFAGEKTNLGYTIIVQGIDDTDIWYSNLANCSVNLYDYIEKDSIIGDVDDYLIIDIIKNKKHLSYEEYIKEN